MITTLTTATYDCPLGRMKIAATEKGIISLQFTHEARTVFPDDSTHLQDCLHQLDEYFFAHRQHFELALGMQGSAFELDVWNEVLKLRFGETATYGDIARALGRKGASRAVGSALHRNPLLIIVPCHRIIPASGGLGEYAAGRERKDWLIRHERA